jgi:hypothetical protein
MTTGIRRHLAAAEGTWLCSMIVPASQTRFSRFSILRRPPLRSRGSRLPRFGTRFTTLYPIGTIIRAVDLVRNRLHLAKVRGASLGLGFPLDRHMAMLVTPRRLLIWKAHRYPRRVGDLLGEVPQAKIAAAKMPFSSTGPWRTIRVSMTDARGLRTN